MLPDKRNGFLFRKHSPNHLKKNNQHKITKWLVINVHFINRLTNLFFIFANSWEWNKIPPKSALHKGGSYKILGPQALQGSPIIIKPQW